VHPSSVHNLLQTFTFACTHTYTQKHTAQACTKHSTHIHVQTHSADMHKTQHAYTKNTVQTCTKTARIHKQTHSADMHNTQHAHSRNNKSADGTRHSTHIPAQTYSADMHRTRIHLTYTHAHTSTSQHLPTRVYLCAHASYHKNANVPTSPPHLTMHTYTHINKYRNTHIHTHARTHARTHTHTHTQTIAHHHAGHGTDRLPHGAQEQLWAPSHHRAQRCHGELEVRASDLAASREVSAKFVLTIHHQIRLIIHHQTWLLAVALHLY